MVFFHAARRRRFAATASLRSFSYSSSSEYSSWACGKNPETPASSSCGCSPVAVVYGSSTVSMLVLSGPYPPAV